MKQLLLVAMLFLSNFVFANRIDSLKNDKEVADFIHQLYVQKYPDAYDNKSYSFSLKKPDSAFFIIKCDSTIRTWNLKSWWKIDFNQDNKTDLFAIIYIRNIHEAIATYHICTAIDNGNNTFDLKEVPDYYYFGCYAAMPVIIQNKPFIIFRHHSIEDSINLLTNPDTPNIQYYDVVKTDTLLYKYGGFIEVNNNPKQDKQVESIYFETSPCMGVCPSFKLNIYKDGTSFYVRNETFDKRAANFRTTINQKQLDDIIGLIRYININALDNSYTVNATDMQDCTLNIYFSDGTVKEISDYGLQGTSGLVRLYGLLSDLRLNQNWK